MLIDARGLEQNRVIEADVCLIGAGAAGITIARALSARSLSVSLLESGGFALDPSTQSLYAGRSEGTIIGSSSTYLSRSRLRYFGGSTNHWTGFCRPLDDDDFERRPWVPYSGWPFAAAELTAFYRQATEVLQIEPFASEPESIERNGRTETSGIFPDDQVVVTRRYHFSHVRFRPEYQDELIRDRNVTVLTYANVTTIDTDEAGSRVTGLRVATLTGKRLVVRSKVFVLAAGGVENARLLLISDGVRRNGLGNQHDLVGRFFMEHLEGGVGFLVLTDRLDTFRLYNARRGSMGALCLSARTRRPQELLNASVELNFDNPLRAESYPSEAGGVPLAIDPALSRLDHVLELSASEEVPKVRYARCIIRAEQSPNPESRVTIDREVDALGVRRAKLQWQVNARDGESARRTLEVIARSSARTGLGGA